LIDGEKKSCGCLFKERPHLTKHGHSKTPEYDIWRQAKQRCLNPNDKAFPHYGARGITFHPPWQKDFPAFLEHVGPRPSKDHELDRIDNNRGYEPGNLRWTSRKTQTQNRRGAWYVDYRGEMRHIADLAREHGLKQNTVRERLRRGWDIEKALNTPLLFTPSKDCA
jgi:hypothetical protein